MIKLNSKYIFKYQAYKYFKESVKNIFTIQVKCSLYFSDLLQTNKCLCVKICMEYLEGNTLEFLINQHQSYAILDNTLKTFCMQLLDALDYLHTNNVFHRDLKVKFEMFQHPMRNQNKSISFWLDLFCLFNKQLAESEIERLQFGETVHFCNIY